MASPDTETEKKTTVMLRAQDLVEACRFQSFSHWATSDFYAHFRSDALVVFNGQMVDLNHQDVSVWALVVRSLNRFLSPECYKLFQTNARVSPIVVVHLIPSCPFIAPKGRHGVEEPLSPSHFAKPDLGEMGVVVEAPLQDQKPMLLITQALKALKDSYRDSPFTQTLDKLLEPNIQEHTVYVPDEKNKEGFSKQSFSGPMFPCQFDCFYLWSFSEDLLNPASPTLQEQEFITAINTLVSVAAIQVKRFQGVVTYTISLMRLVSGIYVLLDAASLIKTSIKSA